MPSIEEIASLMVKCNNCLKGWIYSYHDHSCPRCGKEIKGRDKSKVKAIYAEVRARQRLARKERAMDHARIYEKSEAI